MGRNKASERQGSEEAQLSGSMVHLFASPRLPFLHFPARQTARERAGELLLCKHATRSFFFFSLFILRCTAELTTRSRREVHAPRRLIRPAVPVPLDSTARVPSTLGTVRLLTYSRPRFAATGMAGEHGPVGDYSLGARGRSGSKKQRHVLADHDEDEAGRAPSRGERHRGCCEPRASPRLVYTTVRTTFNDTVESSEHNAPSRVITYNGLFPTVTVPATVGMPLLAASSLAALPIHRNCAHTFLTPATLPITSLR